MKNLNFVAGMTRRLVDSSDTFGIPVNSLSIALQSPVREVKMLAVLPSIAIRKVSDESLGRDETPRHTSYEI